MLGLIIFLLLISSASRMFFGPFYRRPPRGPMGPRDFHGRGGMHGPGGPGGFGGMHGPGGPGRW